MKRLPMRKIREFMRLRAEGLSGRRVAQSLSLGRTTVSEYVRRANVAGLSWPLPDDLSDTDLEHRRFPHDPGESARDIPLPNWAYAHSMLWGKRRFKKFPKVAKLNSPLSGLGDQPVVAISFSFFGDMPGMMVSDYLTAAVIKACFYNPEIDRAYGDMATHYGTAVVPARPQKPKGKAKVENAAKLTERWILAKL